ncbi:agmatinase family protein [Sphaerochaeta sp.]|uniref:agmatinase family protein n=1 Tax=Sphaerochaeta sp. TaxID=1972642 RepID=UPI003D0B545B
MKNGTLFVNNAPSSYLEIEMNNKPLCYVKRNELPEIFPGVPSFMGLPTAKTAEDIKQYDAAVLGVPWEGPLTWGKFSGCEMCTKTIRDASLRYGGYLPEYGYDLFDYISACDCGDTPVVPGDIEATYTNIHKRIKDIVDNGVIPVTFGGDHSISVPLINALAEKYKGRLGILHLDAHMDNMVSYGDEKFARCSPFYRLYENPNIDPTKIVHAGIRGPRNNPAQIKNAQDVGATVITGYEIRTKGIDHVIARSLDVIKTDTDAVYVSVCSDALDVAFNPAGAPDMCGMTSFELSKLLYETAKAGVNGFDMVEIYPMGAGAEISSHVASWMAIYLMSGIAANKAGL